MLLGHHLNIMKIERLTLCIWPAACLSQYVHMDSHNLMTKPNAKTNPIAKC